MTDPTTSGGQLLNYDENLAASREILHTIPGIDLVTAAADGRQVDVPKAGWLINATVAPAGCGSVTITRYINGKPQVNDVQDNRPRDGEVAASLDIPHAAAYQFAYETPDYEDTSTEPMDRRLMSEYIGFGFNQLDVHSLANGGRLLAQRSRLGKPNLQETISVFALDPSRIDTEPEVPIVRVTGDSAELQLVVGQLCGAMGMGPEDIDLTVNAVGKKIGLTNKQ